MVANYFPKMMLKAVAYRSQVKTNRRAITGGSEQSLLD